MIVVGIGANLQSPDYGAPLITCEAALDVLSAKRIAVVRRSRWYRSLPIPESNQPPFVNGTIEVATSLDPAQLLHLLHTVETDFGRKRGKTNAARILDLDLLSYHNEITDSDAWVRLPHPRMHERAFVLKPLAELAPHWRHPVLGLTVSQLLIRIPFGQSAQPIESGTSNAAPT